MLVIKVFVVVCVLAYSFDVRSGRMADVWRSSVHEAEIWAEVFAQGARLGKEDRAVSAAAVEKEKAREKEWILRCPWTWLTAERVTRVGGWSHQYLNGSLED